MALSTTYTPSAPAAVTTQGSAVTNREDLSNELALLAPEETPLLSLCSKGKCSSTYYEWPVDKLASVNTAGTSEGSDVSSFDDKFASRARIGNYISHLRRSWLVSSLQDAVTSAGSVDSAEAEAKAMRELKRDIEASLCSNNDFTVENGAGTPYRMRGLGDWLDASGPSQVPSDYRTPTASILAAAVTDRTLNDALGSIYSKTGAYNNMTVIANVALRKVIANFTRADYSSVARGYEVTQNGDTKKITLSVTLFESDFGVINVVNANPDAMPAAATNEGYIVNPKFLGFNTLIPMSSVRLENQGGGKRGFVECAGTFVCKHPQAHGKIAYS